LGAMDASAKDLARAKFRGQHGRGRRPPHARAAGQAAVPEQGRRAARALARAAQPTGAARARLDAAGSAQVGCR